MSVFYLSRSEYLPRLKECLDKQTPAIVVRSGSNDWQPFESRIVAVEDQCLCLDWNHKTAPLDPNEHVGIHFRLAGRRYSFAGKVLKQCAPGEDRFCVALPAKIREVSARIEPRCTVPSGHKVSAMFWPGGFEVSPSEDSPDVPACFGEVLDLSTGGCRLQAKARSAALIGQSDVIGVVISFPNLTILSASAHVVSMQRNDSHVIYSLRFNWLAPGMDREACTHTLRQMISKLCG